MTLPKRRLDEEFSKTVLTQQADDLLKELVSSQRCCCEKSIHDIRVQSRRMRAALEAFRDLFNPHLYRELYRTVRKITRILGKPRETAVVLKLLCDLSDADEMAEGICQEYLAERIEKKLRKQEKRLRRNLNGIEPLRLQSQIQLLIAGMDPHAARNKSVTTIAGQVQTLRRSMQQPFQPTLFQMFETDRERAQPIFKELAQPILAFRPRYHFHLATDDKLHELRISAKKFRYAMELFAPLWPHRLSQ